MNGLEIRYVLYLLVLMHTSTHAVWPDLPMNVPHNFFCTMKRLINLSAILSCKMLSCTCQV